MEKIIIYCLPFAGGNKYSYRKFSANAPDYLEFITLEYPGRGSRISEPLLTDILEIVDDLFPKIKVGTKGQQYALYGHSMGGLVAFLLARKIVYTRRSEPVHLFVSGTVGPSANRGEKARYAMEKSDLISEIRHLGGVTDELLLNDELLDYFLPIIRSDFESSETYNYEHAEPLNIPITVITGTDEDMEEKDILLWQDESIHDTKFYKMEGAHFFIFDHIVDIIEKMSRQLF